jgi:hypothetical protein
MLDVDAGAYTAELSYERGPGHPALSAGPARRTHRPYGATRGRGRIAQRRPSRANLVVLQFGCT